MTQLSSCPDNDQLLLLLDEKLSGVSEIQLVQHLDHCLRCQSRLEALVNKSGREVIPAMSQSPSLPAIWHLAGNGHRSPSENGLPVRDENAFQQIENSFPGESTGLRLLERIGQGGMGVVLKAHDLALERPVAVKFISPQLAEDPAARQRFLREARAAAGITHSQVVTIHSVNDRQPFPFFTMEWIDGLPLNGWLDGNRLLETETLIDIGCQLARGLAAAHDGGVIHRDIKPENILLDSRSGQVKITDFGLARVMDEYRLTHTDVFLGSPGFQAPESLETVDSVDQRSDLFSLGCVLYFLCAKVPPFEHPSLIRSLQHAARGIYRPLREVAPRTPASLERVIVQLLRPDPKERFPDAREVERQLQSCLRSVIPPPVSPRPAQDSLSLKVRTRQGSRIDQRPNAWRWPAWGLLLVGALAPVFFLLGNLFAGGALAERQEASVNRDLPGQRRVEPVEDTRVQATAFSGKHKEMKRATRISKDPLMPFVLEVADQEPTGFRTLNGAIAAAGDGATIRVDSSERFEFYQPITVPHGIRLLAAESRRPIFDVYLAGNETEDEEDPDHEMEDDDNGDGEGLLAFLQLQGRTTIRGIDFQLHPVEEIECGLIQTDAPLVAEDCGFSVPSEGIALVSQSEVDLEFVGCRFQVPAGLAIGGEADQEGQATFRNCLIAGDVVLRLATESPFRVLMENCTCFSNRFAELFPGIDFEEEFLGEPFSGGTSFFQFDVQHSVLCTREGLLVLEADDGLFQRQHRRFLGWKGEGNLLVDPGVILWHEDGYEEMDEISWCQGLATWKKKFVEVDSLTDPAPFRESLESLYVKLENRQGLSGKALELKEELKSGAGFCPESTDRISSSVD
ncbi:MAG: protein kinase [Planctomycetota bacterium]|nr:protein kinase [Planctomycetota bacterium]